MSTRRLWLLLLLSIPGWSADKGSFKVEPASTYPNKQSANGLTIAVVAYSTPEQMKTAFGKLNLQEFGVLPVLLVMQNDSGKALRLDRMEVFYVTSNRQEVAATPGSDVLYLDPPKRPRMGGNPLPIPQRKRKSKLAAPEIEGYALNAKMLPAADTAHGFVYFQTAHRPGSHLYIRGIVEAPTGKELLFFEIPLD